MKRFFITLTLLTAMAALASACCFNPFFYVPLEELGAAGNDTPPAVRSTGTGNTPPESDYKVLHE